MRILGMPAEELNQLLESLQTQKGGGALSRSAGEGRGGGGGGDLRFGLAFSGVSGSHELILDLARAADRAGLASLWLPERHFQPLAGLSPNPSVLAAAVARETERIALRAGSVALPLHHPVRIVEEWALVDNLSGGRVGLSFAAGGRPDDFVLASAGNGHHGDLGERVATLRRLWRGETVRLRDGAGSEVDLRVYPLPARRDLPVWISAGDDPDLFRQAGEMGAGVLTHLLGQTIGELAANLAIYREALDRAGRPPAAHAAGHVTLLLPTFLDADAESAAAAAQQPLAELLEARSPVLVGSCDSVAPLVERLRDLGVDEIACLVDFGVDAKRVRAALPWIAELQRRFRAPRRRPAGEAPLRFPLTEAQRDLWTVAQLGEEASLAFLEAGLIEVRGPLDPDLLRESLQEEVDRHEALRSFLPAPAAGEEPFQEVLPELDLDLPFVDLSALPAGRREEAARGWAEQESWRRFDLARAPLFRATVARLAPGIWRLGFFGHHIAVDGLSIAIVLTETLAIYEAGRAGRRAALPEPLQFREYAAWLAAGGAESPEDEAFWLAEMAGPLPVFEPPSDRPRPPVRTFRGARRRRVLDPALDQGLRQTARKQRSTPFIGLLAAWTALLHRWTGQEDLIVGGPSARRPLEGGDRLVGHCVDLVPYRSRTDGPGEPAFTEHLAALRRFVFASHEHGGYPLARLLRRLDLPHDPSRVPLINAVFNMDPGLEITHAAGLGLAEVSPVITHAKYDVAVHLLQADEDLVLYLDYRCDLFDPATMDRLLDHLETLIGGAVADPSRPLGDLPLLSAAEQSQILVEWNRTESGSPLDTPVHGLFDAVAERTPEAPAVIWSGPEGEEESLTYRELRHRADSLARHLRGMGVGPEVPVVLEMERSPELVVALLAVLKAGGFYVPLDPSDPEERRAFVLEDTGAAVRLGGEEIGQIRPIGPIRPIKSPDALAYTLYTSGSTGRPKGVAVPHRAVVRLALADYVRLTPQDRLGHLSNTAFDAATFEIWGALLNGASLVVIPREVAVVPADLGAEIRRRGVTAAFFTVALFNEVVREAPEALAGMRWVLAGGEAVSPDRMREALAAAAGTGTRFLNGYGPTESTTFALTHWITAAPPGRPIPIGRPISDTRAYVVDRLLRPVPVGTPGELCLGGAGLARGYFRRPTLTAERFVPDPFAPEERGGDRLYRTGDLARFQPDGAVEYLGRTDAQVKIRGFRVEPGEIEAALVGHPAVREAAVVAQEAAGGRRLAAFLVPEEGADLGDSALHDLLRDLRERLPKWMVPAAVSVVEALPRTPSGKIDRRALAREAAQSAPEAPFEAPRTPVEELVAAAWAEVLQRERIGLHDDFFSLGGHSLLATQVISRLRVSCGVELPLRLFFGQPRLAEMAAAVEEALRGERSQEGIPQASDPSGHFPLSFAQQRLWFIDRFAPGSPVYNIPAFCRIAGPLSPETLGLALHEIGLRHEALRTIFAQGDDGQPRQVIAPEPRLPLPVVDLGGLPPGLRQAEEERITAAEASRPFDLTAGPVARALLLRAAPDDHTLFLNLHHIAADGWSLGVLARELSALYTAFAEGAPSPLPDLPVQYADVAVWQRRRLTGAVLDEQLAWWRRHLAGAPARLELPTDRPRPAQVDLAGAHISEELPAELTAAIQALAHREGATPFLVWLAAYAALLSRWTGQEAVVIGTPVAHRNRAETEGLIGFFVNTLPLHIRLGGLPSFRELLARVRDVALGGFAHQDVPLEKLIEELHPERDPSRNPLVETLFSSRFVPPQPTSGLKLGLKLGPWQFVASGTAKLDLTFQVITEEGWIDCEHRTSLFDPATLRRLLQGFRNLLAGAVAAPETAAAGLPWFGAAERHQILAEWGRADLIAPDLPVHTLFDAVAERDPAAPAVLWSGPEGEEEVLTFGELRERAGRLALRLREMGVGPEVPVALEMERSPELVVAMLAVLKAGGFYVPVDPADPAERRAFIVEDTGAAVRVGDKDTKDFKDTKDTLSLQSLATLSSFDSPPGALAHVIYTSGSTGRPKGAMIPHRGVVRLALGDYMRLGPGDRVSHLSNTAFDAATFEVWGALLNGAAVVVIPREVAVVPAALAAELRRRRVTAAFFTVSLFSEIVREVPEVLAGLRQVFTGGEAVPPDRMREALAAGAETGTRLFNAYGPTESTTFALIHRATTAPPGRAIPIGRPISGTRAHVVDRLLRPVPLGTPGELCLGGEGLARGYLGRPELTAERFVPDPFVEEGRGGERLYRTGDLARFLPDGALDFLGRTDAQVKIRGFRVEPGEIEAVLAGHPAVREAVVVAQEVSGGRRLAAFLVAEEGADLGPAALHEILSGLRERLPHWMVPAAASVLEALPRTPSGKIDRRALALQVVAEGAPEAPFEAPRTLLEELVAAAWAEVLQRERIGLRDDFFALGGHSLLATQVVSRLRASCGVDLPLRRFFARPRLAEMAAEIEELLRAGEEPSPPAPLPRAGEGGGLPLSFAQERLWFLDRFAPGSPVYNIPAFSRISGPLDPEALGRALREVGQRHEVLRTTFATGDAGLPRQVIAPEPRLPLPFIDLGGLPPGPREMEEERLAAAEANRPFDLTTGPLARALLLRAAPDDHALFLNLHHIVADGWSLGILARELSALYPALAAGAPSPLPELPVQYADFAVWQRRWLSGAALDEQLAWWRQHLAGAPAQLDLPTDRPRTATVELAGGHVSEELPAELAAGIQTLARREGVTPFMVGLAAFATLLSRWSGQEELVLGTPVANRNRVETEPLIGFFVNTLPLHVSLAGGPSFRELLARVRETALGGFTHQDVPLEKLIEELHPARDPSRNPLVEVLFSLGFALPPPTSGLALGPWRFVAPDTAKFDLVVELAAEDGAVHCEHRTSLFDRSTVHRLLQGFVTLLAGAVAAPETEAAGLPLLSAAEEAEIAAWSRTPGPEAEGDPVPRLVLAAAARTPDAVALVAGENVWTYGEMAAAALRLADRLREQGVGPETRVALSFERSPELAVAALGVLCSGGAYLPLDPESPPERNAFIVEDAGAALRVGGEEIGQIGQIGPSGPSGLINASLTPVENPGLAYVIYTSGSTGRPRGVEVPHAGLLNLVRWHLATYGLTAADRASVLAAPSFDASVWEIWPALCAGASLHFTPAGARLDPAALVEWLAEEEVTIGFLPTPLAEAVLDEPWPAGAALRFLLTGGDRLGKRPAAHHPFVLVNHYGPTESSVVAAAGPVEPRGEGAPSIGRPIAGLSLWILDRSLRPVPVGAAGEICLGGNGLARGYAGRPDGTAERFVPDPSGEPPGARLYRTGDLARRRRDGTVEFLGRVDFQVKIRGFRIELGEIEAALARQPEVREAIVLARPGVAGDPRLVAWVVGADGPPPPDELRRRLADSLPAYMIPSAFVELDRLPLTPHGKVDRRALPDPPEEADPGTGVPRGEVQEMLASLWTGLLGVEHPGPQSDFFALGGHSLLATQMISRLRAAYGIEVPLRLLFAHPKLGDLAAVVEETLRSEAPPLVPVPRNERGPELPLSFFQQRLWFLDRFAPGSPAYNIPAFCRIARPLSVPSLERALREVARRHEILRTTFAEGSSGTPCQVIAPEPLVPLPVVDLGGLPPEARSTESGRLLQAEAVRPFDLEAGPLIRALLLRSAADDFLLSLNLHHIVADGGSIHLLMRELSSLYTAGPLPDLPVQYADFAVWQRRRLTGPALDEQLAWWRRHLAEAPARLELPTDRPRPAMLDLAGAHVSEELPAELSAGVQALARREGATPFMVWLAACATLLSRWTGQDDLVIGTPVAHRNRAETENLIGFFVNTLPLRANLAGLFSFRDVLARVRETALGGFTHQDVPLERLVEEIHPERDPSRTPLVEALFSLQGRNLSEDPELGEWRFVTTGTAKFDLSFEVEESVDCEYRTSLFDPATIRRLLRGFVTLLAGAVAAPETEAAGLPLFSPAERHQILVEWGAAESASPLETPVHVLFDAVAERDPEAPAVIWSGPEGEEESLTYAALRDRADNLALHLRGLGVGLEVPVVLELERTAGLVVAMLAVLKAGGFYVPVDPADPAERRAVIVEDVGAAVRLGGEEIGQIRPIGPIRPIKSLEAFSAGHRLAYTIYTSGSTGKPKGVMVPHQGVVRLALADYIRLAPGDRVGQLSNTAFDVATFDIWGALLNGAAVVMIPREVIAEPAALAAEIRRRRVTAGFFTVSLFNEMVRVAPETLLGMRWALAGGEAVSPDAMRGILTAQAAAGPGTRFLNGYGPTECTVFALTHRITAAPPGLSIPIGRPISDTRAQILDRRLRPAPLGTPGELCLGGEGLARGYFRRPDLTAERFIPDPFARNGERLYRTGDLARFLPDGTVEYLGRTDAQVKIRGFRVEPGEIEAALADHPAVREAAVVAQEALGGRRLAAFLVAEEGADLGAAALHELLQGLRGRLPHWMVPASVSVVDTLPKTPSGKIDRRALTLREAQGAPEAPFEAPRTPVEELVAAVWAEVLQRDRVGLRDDFFALGGHSLLAAQVISRLRASCGVELPLRRFFARPQLADLAADIEQALREEPLSSSAVLPSPAGGRGAGGEGFPLSFAQQRLWFVAELAPESPALNIPAPFHLAGPLDVPALERALAEVVRRHEALRVSIVRRGGALLQSVAPAAPVALPRIDLSALPPENRAAEADRLSREEGKRPFDLAAGPLWRAALLRLGPEAHRLVPVLHHIVCDGLSVDILERELAVLYEAFAAGRPSPLPPLPLQYPDFALWQRRRLTEEALAPSLDYWRQSLAGLRPLELPADRPRPRRRSGRGTFRSRPLPADVSAAAHRLAQSEGASLYMVLLAAFFALLEKATGQTDLAVGSPVAGRDHLEHEGMIGLFVNSLVLRTGLGGDPSFRELLRRVRETTLGAFTHQEVPFERLVEELDPQREAGRTPLFQVMFGLLYEKPGPRRTDSGGIGMVRLNEHNDTAQFDLTLYMGESGGTLTAAFEYATDLFTAATIDWMLARFEDLLAAATADPGRRLSTLPPEQWLALQVTAAPEPPAEPESRLQALQNSVEERRSRLSDEARELLARRLRGRPS